MDGGEYMAIMQENPEKDGAEVDFLLGQLT